MSLGELPSWGTLASGLAIGTIGSLFAIIIVAVLARTRVVMELLGSRYRLAQTLSKAGMTKFHLSRDDYGRTLRTYLSRATHSISIVSVSLKQTHDEGDLIEAVQTKTGCER